MPTQETDLDKVAFEFEALEACLFCGARALVPSGKISWLDNDFWYVVCPTCGLKFMNPRPTRESYQAFYANQFWQQKIRNKGFHQPGQAWNAGTYTYDNEEAWDPDEGRKNRMEKHREQRPKTIIPVIDAAIGLNEKKKVLEVGCGYGITLEVIHKEYKSQVYAIEPSTDAQAMIKKNEYIKLVGSYAEELEKIVKGDERYDAIIFSHVLENTTKPHQVIRWAKESLAKGGILYLQTPNLLVNDQMNPYHPFIFSDSSFRMLADKLHMRYERKSGLIDRMLIAIMQ
ncbi:MAG: hypothetical protein AUJ72_01245 [Candidatus Omnitrophica bacterium CG1_02_46_14]|nr:MAG: hypothetical protein AUJ72_01245 [Candidatus Omnitrophica bacterium CG1_02_46_14]